MNAVHPLLLAAARGELADWKREAEGSRRSQAEYLKRAAEHESDAERAEAQVAALEQALRSP